jgi:hypothetical protein
MAASSPSRCIIAPPAKSCRSTTRARPAQSPYKLLRNIVNREPPTAADCGSHRLAPARWPTLANPAQLRVLNALSALALGLASDGSPDGNPWSRSPRQGAWVEIGSGMIRSVENFTVCGLSHTTAGANRVECSFSLDLRPATNGRPSFVHLRDSARANHAFCWNLGTPLREATNRRWGFESPVRKPTPPGQHIRLERRFVRFQDVTRKARKMLRLRSIGAKAEFKAKGSNNLGVCAHAPAQTAGRTSAPR